MSTDIESRLKAAYIANGGSEQVFESIKGDLIADYRKQVTITDALEDARRPASINDLLRMEMQHVESHNDDLLQRTFKKGNTDDVA